MYPRSTFNAGDFAILKCSVEDVLEGEPYHSNTIVAKGRVYSLDYGVVYTLEGTYERDPKYGEGYKIVSFNQEFALDSSEDKRDYLIQVLTTKEYQTLVEALPDPFQTLRDGDIETLAAIKGLGDYSARRLVSKFNAKLDQAKAFVYLSRFGMSMTAIHSLMTRYPSVDALIDMVDKNPYLMIQAVDGIGWKKADAIALGRGIATDSVERISAYIEYYLQCRSDEGHTWADPQDLWGATVYDLGIDNQDAFRTALYSMQQADKLWWNDEHSQIALSYLRNIEMEIAQEMFRLSSAPPLPPSEDATRAIGLMEQEQGWSFTEEQLRAIKGTLDSNVSIITGAAGTGKSSVVKGMLKVLRGRQFAQCALSGRAAARLGEVTGEAGCTIHRLLRYQNGAFSKNKNSPLEDDIIILDEISMVGAEIFLDLLRAIPTGSKLIMLGDDGQLESIGLCNIFKDMLNSDVIPVGRLTQIHRQAAKSAIITESRKVRHHEQLAETGWYGTEIRGELQDLELQVYGDPILTKDNILLHYKKLLNQGVSSDDIQIIVPMRIRGEASTLALNTEIQGIVNHNKETQVAIATTHNKTQVEYYLRLGDRVIATKNMYKAERANEYDESGNPIVCPVFNGDRGYIKEINNGYMIIAFDMWGDIIIHKQDFSRIELGYALSCHKLQGSEANYVIIGFDMSSRILLTKEWLYTAITRAKKYCVVTALDKALSYCIMSSNISSKKTFLCDMLRERYKGGEQAKTV